MSKAETLTTDFGLMMDLLSCKAINEGKADLKKAVTNFDDILAMR